jgi:glycosyltransferase involved in cell wall biosynthesis
VRRLRQDQPQVILCYGWNTPIAWLGILFAAFTGTPLLYYGDSTWQHAAGTWNAQIRKFVLRALFWAAAGAISTGTFNREFYIFHGLDPARVYPGVCPADTEFFSAAVQRPSRGARSPGDDRALIIGFAGKFVTNKAPQDLIDAASRLPRDVRWELWLIGDGPLRAELESLAGEHELTDQVRFHGFKNTDELPALMRAIDVMVVPSRKDLRVLVTIEAMVAGSAVVVSSGTAVWGPGDLIQDDQTGLVYPAGNVDALATCLRRLIEEPDLRTRLAKSGRARALSFGPQDFAEMTAAALVSAARKHRHVRDNLCKKKDNQPNGYH